MTLDHQEQKLTELRDFMARDDLPFDWNMGKYDMDCGCLITAAYHCFGLRFETQRNIDMDPARRALDFNWPQSKATFVPNLHTDAENFPHYGEAWFYTKERAVRALDLLIADPDCRPWELLWREHETGQPIDMENLS